MDPYTDLDYTDSSLLLDPEPAHSLVVTPMYNVQGHPSDERSGYGMLWLFLCLSRNVYSQAPQGVPECPEHYKRNVEADMRMHSENMVPGSSGHSSLFWLAILGGVLAGLLLSTLLFGRM